MIQRLMTPCYALIVLFFLSSQVYASYDDWSSRVKSCAGWDCSPNKYGNETICPQGSKGASGTSYICKNDKWVPVLVKSCAGWDCSVEGQLCPKGAEGALGQDFVCHRKNGCQQNAAMHEKLEEQFGDCRLQRGQQVGKVNQTGTKLVSLAG